MSREGFPGLRLCMVLSSMAPLFLLWAIRGTSFISSGYFLAFCAAMVIGPIFILALRIGVATRGNEFRTLITGESRDTRDHILVYLLTMLLPLYRPDFATWRDVGASVAVVCLIVFIFWTMNLHYMNVLFRVFGYSVFIVAPYEDDNPYSGSESWTLIARRSQLPAELHIRALRITNTLYLERAQ